MWPICNVMGCDSLHMYPHSLAIHGTSRRLAVVSVLIKAAQLLQLDITMSVLFRAFSRTSHQLSQTIANRLGQF